MFPCAFSARVRSFGVIQDHLVQTLNSPFFPPHIGAQPYMGREERRVWDWTKDHCGTDLSTTRGESSVPLMHHDPSDLGSLILVQITHSRPLSPRSFWPAAGIESSDRSRFSDHAQSIRFVFSANQICQIWREVRESRTSGVGQSQSSRSLPQVRMIVGSGDDNPEGTHPKKWQMASKFGKNNKEPLG